MGFGLSIRRLRVRVPSRTGDFAARLDLEDFDWKTSSAKNVLSIGKWKFKYSIHGLDVDSDGSAENYINFMYDHYYGGAERQGKTGEMSAHVAIVHEADIKNSTVVGLAQFRFKTWEDGLGNKCDVAPSRVE